MEDFVVSARKYRPKSFESVVGQESITKTLLKAVEQNQLAQAFLFCGPRGVGKTTCARILARTVNEHAMGKVDVDEDFAFNIFELDAASNNSVDDIRSLIDQVRVPPQVGKYKVYIIDEVHMLSTQAFNAFLKTLEEPPAYAIFILATTEKHKVLPTILSRCQVFDFHRIQIPQMVAHLQGIAASEGIDAESDALHIIAEKADGALRDALSIFDQMVSFAGKRVTYADVISNLNVLDYDYYFNLVDNFLEGNRAAALVTFNQIISNGFDGHNFITGLANHFRNLLFCIDPATTAILEVGDNVRERYLAQAAACDVRFMLNAINILSDADSNYKNSRSQRLLVELCLLKLCNLGTGVAEKKNGEHDELIEVREPSSRPSPPLQHITPQAKASAAQIPVVAPAVSESSSESKAANTPSDSTFETIIPSKPENNLEESKVSEPLEKPEAAVATPDPTEPAPRDNGRSDSKEDEATSINTVVNESSEEKKPVASFGESPAPAATAFSSRLSNRKSKDMPSLKDTGMSIGKGPSGNTSANDSSQNQVSPLTGERPATPFNLAQLWEVWDEYAADIREQDRQSYYSTLTKRKPIVREANKIELIIDNHVQLNDLDADKTNILTHLRERLNNWHIQLEGVIEEAESGDDVHLYTPEERFKAMLETNPSLGLLRQQFDLDIEHD